MTRAAALLALPLILAGCEGKFGKPRTRDEVHMAADGNGSVAIDLPFFDGKVKVPGMMMQGGNIDLDGVRPYPGSRIGGFTVDAKDGRGAVRMTLDADASPAAVRDYYVKRFNEEGATVAATSTRVSGHMKDGGDIGIVLTPQGSGTHGTITIQDHDKGRG